MRSKITNSQLPIGLGLAAVLITAALARLYGLGEEAIWYDEWVSVHSLQKPTIVGFLQRLRQLDPPMQPAYYTVLYVWHILFGGNEIALRALSVLCGLGSIAAVFALACRAGGLFAGLVAGFGLALAKSHVYYSQEIRVYGFILVFAALSMFAIVEAIHGNRGRTWWTIHVVCNNVLIATHFFAALFVVATGLFLLLIRAASWRANLAWAAAHLPGIAVAMYFLATLNQQALNDAAAWISDVPFTVVPWTLFVVYLGARGGLQDPLNNLTGYEFLQFVPVVLLGISLVAMGVAYLLRRNPHWPWFRERRWRDALILSISCAVVPVICLYAISEFYRPSYQDRYTVFAMLGSVLALGLVFTAVPWRFFRLFLGGLFVVFMVGQLAATDRPLRVPWDAAARAVIRTAEHSPAVMVLPAFNYRALEHYLGSVNLRIEGVNSPDEATAMLSDIFLSGKQTAWIFWYEIPRASEALDSLTGRRAAIPVYEMPDVPAAIDQSGYAFAKHTFHVNGYRDLKGVYIDRRARNASPGNARIR